MNGPGRNHYLVFSVRRTMRPGRVRCVVCAPSLRPLSPRTQRQRVVTSTGPQVREGGHSAGHRRADIETILDRHQDTSTEAAFSAAQAVTSQWPLGQQWTPERLARPRPHSSRQITSSSGRPGHTQSRPLQVVTLSDWLLPWQVTIITRGHCGRGLML